MLISYFTVCVFMYVTFQLHRILHIIHLRPRSMIAYNMISKEIQTFQFVPAGPMILIYSHCFSGGVNRMKTVDQHE